jgi:predicted house-cleaning noncanonical NTP pyrophosphatase (MazG superfamily)
MLSHQEIMKKCGGFSKSQNIEVLKHLMEIGAKIIESGDGSRINLNKLSKRKLKGLSEKICEIDKPIAIEFQI